MTAVELKSVTKRHGSRIILEKLSLVVPAGSRLVLIGPSGCGKTTLLRLLAGLAVPDSGEIIFNGQIVSAQGKNLKEPAERGIGMVFQDLALWPHLTVRGNLEYMLRPASFTKEEKVRRIQEMLKKVQFNRSEDCYPSILSGGEQQRVALARALVHRPSFLLMDEPLSSMDYALSAQLRREIIQLQQEIGFTVIYVTHNLDEAYDMATSIAILKNGQVDWLGPPREAKKYLQQLYSDNEKEKNQ